MTPQEIERAADMLFEAEQTGIQCGLVSLEWPNITLDEAYLIQADLIEKKKVSGRKVIGWKIGLTSRAMQQALNITTPDSGVLLDNMRFESGTTVPAGRFIQPRVEAEIAFVMNEDISGATVTRDDVIAATQYV
ncbi:MAG: 2-oxo-hepta-3-ene-1,7-dioic acid hydratase, partial [Pseudomonadota bacterium]